MQSEQVDARAPMPTLGSLDEEFGGVAPELEYRPRRQRWRYFCFLLAGALVAATSAVMWPSNAPQLWAFAQWLPSLSAEQAASRSSTESVDIELDALKKEISELRYEQQKLSAEMSALQTAQQELQRSSAKAAASWFSEPNALMYQRIVPAPKPRTAARGIPSGGTRAANADPGNGNGPAPPLARSQTTATGAVPIR